jgi:hypothetical protein
MYRKAPVALTRVKVQKSGAVMSGSMPSRVIVLIAMAAELSGYPALSAGLRPARRKGSVTMAGRHA